MRIGNLGLVLDYETIMSGKKQAFSKDSFSKETQESDVIPLFRYVFDEVLRWDIERLKVDLTIELLNKLHLDKALKKIDFPLGLQNDINWLLSRVYPEQLVIDERDEILIIYKKVRNGELAKYPAHFFKENRGRINALVCLQYAFSEHVFVKNIDEAYDYFSDYKRSIAFLMEHDLKDINKMYEYPIDAFHECLPPWQQDELSYNRARLKLAISRFKGDTGHDSKHKRKSG